MQRSKLLDFDFELGPLEIRADNFAISRVALRFHTEKDQTAGSISFSLDEPGHFKYYLEKCTGWRYSSWNIPDSRYKIWRVDLIRTSDVRVVIHCNNTEVLNFLISDLSCTESWEDWSKSVVKIQFLPDDVASVGFRTYTGKFSIQHKFLVSGTMEDSNS